MLDIGHGYFHIPGIKVTEGREFEPGLEHSDRAGNIIFSKKLIKDFSIDVRVTGLSKIQEAVTYGTASFCLYDCRQGIT